MAVKNEIAINDAFITQLGTQLAEKEKYGLTFPTGYNYRNELMGAYLILKETLDKDKRPVLQSCSPASIANTLMEMANNGLSMQKKQCYPVAYGGKLKCQVSVYGNTCIARRYGLKRINANVIYKGDSFEYHLEDGEPVIDEHKQAFENLGGEIVGAYAIAIMEDGSKHAEIMTRKMIETAWKQGFGYREDENGTHQKFADQMAIKTVKNRCLKAIIRTYGTQENADFMEHQEEIAEADKLAEDVQNDITVNANAEPFPEPEEVMDAEVVVVPSGEAKSDVIDVEPSDLPDFMKMDGES